MSIESRFNWRGLLASALLLSLLVFGCSSAGPYQPRNNREEGPQRGIFTGSDGEFVIPMPGESVKESKSAN